MLQTCFLDYDAIYNIESARSPFTVSWKPLSSHNPKFNQIWKNRSAHRNSNFPLFVHWKVKEAIFGLQSSWWPVYCCLHAEGGQTQWCTISLGQWAVLQRSEYRMQNRFRLRVKVSSSKPWLKQEHFCVNIWQFTDPSGPHVPFAPHPPQNKNGNHPNPSTPFLALMNDTFKQNWLRDFIDQQHIAFNKSSVHPQTTNSHVLTWGTSLICQQVSLQDNLIMHIWFLVSHICKAMVSANLNLAIGFAPLHRSHQGRTQAQASAVHPLSEQARLDWNLLWVMTPLLPSWDVTWSW